MGAEEHPRPGKRKKISFNALPRLTQAEQDEFIKQVRQEEAQAVERLAREFPTHRKRAKKADNKDDESKKIPEEMDLLEELERFELQDIRHDMIELKKAEIQRRLEENRIALERLKKTRVT